MTNPFSRWQNTGIQNPYAGVSAGIQQPARSPLNRRIGSGWANTTVEAPDKFYSGPTERLSAKASPTTSAVEDATAAVNAATGTAAPSTQGLAPPTRSISEGQITQPPVTAEQTDQANQAMWLNLEKVNPQSFAATLQGAASNVTDAYTGRRVGGGGIDPTAQSAIEAFIRQYGGNPWDMNPNTGQYRFGTGYYSYAPWMINPSTGIPYGETERRGQGEGQLAWKGQYSYPVGSHWDFNTEQWVSDTPERAPGIMPPTIPLTTG